MSTISIVIGRMQPPTIAHQELIKKALSLGDRTIVVLGSTNLSISPHNPFTYKERKEMVASMFPEQLEILDQPDSGYDNEDWKAYLLYQLRRRGVSSKDKILLVGHDKDESSYYLGMFPEWDFYEVGELAEGLSATDVRQDVFDLSTGKFEKSKHLPIAVNDTLEQLFKRKPFIWQYINQWKAIVDFKYTLPWENSPYTPIFTTVDALVIYKNRVLIIKRKDFPGKGQYALPGGFVNAYEHISSACKRELLEETGIQAKLKLGKAEVFDFPWRDSRGRFITHVFPVSLKNPVIEDGYPKIKAGDDAVTASWVRIDDLLSLEEFFYADHFKIIRNMLNITLMEGVKNESITSN